MYFWSSLQTLVPLSAVSVLKAFRRLIGQSKLKWVIFPLNKLSKPSSLSTSESMPEAIRWTFCLCFVGLLTILLFFWLIPLNLLENWPNCNLPVDFHRDCFHFSMMAFNKVQPRLWKNYSFARFPNIYYFLS